jgi:outer membrane murein-binding lipoprotein Lpp
VRQSQLDARALNARVGQLERSRQAINAKVEQLNALIEEQNKLNIKATELNNSINGIDNSEVSL